MAADTRKETAPSAKVLMTADAVGGVWQYSADLIRGLTERGAEVLLATLGPRPSEAQKNQVASIPGASLIESEFALEWMENPWDDVDRAGEWLLGLAQEFQPNVVHLNGYTHAGLEWQAPVVTVAHSCVYSWWRAVHGCAPGAEWLEYKRRLSRGLNAAGAVVAPSRHMADALVNEYGIDRTKISVIYNFSSAPPSGILEKEAVTLAAGRMWDPAKNGQLLEYVAPKLECLLEVAGGDEEQARSRLSSVRYLGCLNHDDLLVEMARASIFVHPALYEPFGLAVLEAARAGCCLVLSDIPTLRELWEGAAVFVDPRNADHWTRSLNDLIHTAPERERLAAQAKARAERYNAETAIAAYSSLYDSVRKQRRANNGVAA